jgi:hypothetical protein
MAKLDTTKVAGITSPIAHYLPTIMTWNRLEGRPRTENFDRALKAEVRDPLWMLSKQWQMGEFQGEDAGSAVLAKVHMKTTALTKYQAGEAPTVPLDYDIPLEVKVEHQEISFQIGEQDIALDLRLLMGRHWLKLLKANGFSLKSEYLTAYGFAVPDPSDKSAIQINAHLEVWQQLAAVANRNVDGHKLYIDLKASTDQVSASLGEEVALETLRTKFVTWYEALFYQPIDADNPSWKPSYLEHQFACSAPKSGAEKVLVADEYYHGHLDWYNLDIHNEQDELINNGNNPSVGDDIEDQLTLSFLPSPVAFPGMPHNRWWTLEDWKTNLGNINPSTTDLNQLMLLDFSLNYANDWFMVPFTLPVGSIANVEGLMVTNVFGEKTWVEAASKGQDEDWNKWGMFNLNVRGDLEVPTDLSLLLLPASPKVLEGKPLEEIFLLRDEIANMVWGVESQVPLATGKSKPGREAGQELRNKHQQFADLTASPLPTIVENDAKISYQIVNSVPEEWIPFAPVHKQGSNRQIQLQRAAMPRILSGDIQTPAKIEPRTSILREGLDEAIKQPFFLHEEEVLRAGIKVHKSFQRTRWLNGKVYNWIGFRKQVGRGEGYSGLAFDQINPVEKRRGR